MVMRAASKGGASGRVCAYPVTKFPASRISAANVNAVFHQDFQSMAILRIVGAFKWNSGKAYIYTLAHAFQTKNTGETESQ